MAGDQRMNSQPDRVSKVLPVYRIINISKSPLER